MKRYMRFTFFLFNTEFRDFQPHFPLMNHEAFNHVENRSEIHCKINKFRSNPQIQTLKFTKILTKF